MLMLSGFLLNYLFFFRKFILSFSNTDIMLVLPCNIQSRMRSEFAHRGRFQQLGINLIVVQAIGFKSLVSLFAEIHQTLIYYFFILG